MRRSEREITDKNIIEHILQNSRICRIAMIDNDRPYIVPLNYGYRTNSLYFHSAAAGKKIGLLKQNNQVCFEIEHGNQVIKDDLPCKWSSRYRSLIGYGRINFITGHEEKKAALDIIMSQHGQKDGNVYDDRQVESIIVLRLDIKEISGKQAGKWE